MPTCFHHAVTLRTGEQAPPAAGLPEDARYGSLPRRDRQTRDPQVIRKLTLKRKHPDRVLVTVPMRHGIPDQGAPGGLERAPERAVRCRTSAGRHPSGAKAPNSFKSVTAWLKLCSDTSCSTKEVSAGVEKLPSGDEVRIIQGDSARRQVSCRSTKNNRRSFDCLPLSRDSAQDDSLRLVWLGSLERAFPTQVSQAKKMKRGQYVNQA